LLTQLHFLISDGCSNQPENSGSSSSSLDHRDHKMSLKEERKTLVMFSTNNLVAERE
jgi:hypothetical protein